MKRIAIIAALLLISFTSFAQSGKNIYEKYSDLEGVSAVYISPAMFRLIGAIPDLKTENGDVNLSPIISTLTGMYILNTSKSDVKNSLYEEVKKFVASKKYELLMEAKENGEVMRMYTIGDEKTVNSLVMISNDSQETAFICIDGKMNRSDLEKVLAEQMK